MHRNFKIMVEKGQDGFLIARVLEIPACMTQARTLNELKQKARDAISLHVRNNGMDEIYDSDVISYEDIEVEI